MKRLFFCLAMVLALAACGPAQPASAPTQAAALSATTTTAPATEEPATQAPTTTESTTTEPATTKPAPVGGGIAGIVAFYNQHANAVKSANKITIQKHDVRNTVMDIPKVLKAMMPKDMRNYDPNQNETVTEKFTNGAGSKGSRLDDFLPVNGKPYVSKLSASHVKSASCARQGEGYIVKLYLKTMPFDGEAFGAQMANAQTLSEAQRQKQMEEWMLKMGYPACMDVSAGGGQGRKNSENNENEDASRRNFDMSSLHMQGDYTDGAIVAELGKDGKPTSLSLSYASNMVVTFMGMTVKINSTAKQEFQFTWGAPP